MSPRLTCSVLLAVASAALAAAAPLALDDAIKLALQNNQRVKVSTFNPQIARASVTTAYGAFDPVLTFNRSYGATETAGVFTPPAVRTLTESDHYSLSLDGALPFGTTYSIGATADNVRGSATTRGFLDNYVTFGGVSVTQPLLRGFLFNSSLTALRVAKANRSISDWQHRQTVIDTVTNVVLVYNNLQEARENLRIFTLSRDLAAQLLTENEKKLGVGATSQFEVLKARASVANRQENILIQQRRVKDIENQLRLLVGDAVFAVDGAPLDIVELPPAGDVAVDAAADLRQAYDLRPDYQAAKSGVKIDRLNNALAQSNLLPTVNFVGSYGYGGVNRDFGVARDQVRDEDARAYSAGVVVRLPLTFTESRGRARAAKLTLRRSETDLVRLEQDIAIAVAAGAGQIETTRRRIDAARAAVELAQQALDAENKRQQAGTGSTFFVSTAQNDLAGTQNSYARAQADRRRAIALYEQALGITLITHHIRLE